MKVFSCLKAPILTFSIISISVICYGQAIVSPLHYGENIIAWRSGEHINLHQSIALDMYITHNETHPTVNTAWASAHSDTTLNTTHCYNPFNNLTKEVYLDSIFEARAFAQLNSSSFTHLFGKFYHVKNPKEINNGLGYLKTNKDLDTIVHKNIYPSQNITDEVGDVHYYLNYAEFINEEEILVAAQARNLDSLFGYLAVVDTMGNLLRDKIYPALSPFGSNFVSGTGLLVFENKWLYCYENGSATFINPTTLEIDSIDQYSYPLPNSNYERINGNEQYRYAALKSIYNYPPYENGRNLILYKHDGSTEIHFLDGLFGGVNQYEYALSYVDSNQIFVATQTGEIPWREQTTPNQIYTQKTNTNGELLWRQLVINNALSTPANQFTVVRSYIGFKNGTSVLLASQHQFDNDVNTFELKAFYFNEEGTITNIQTLAAKPTFTLFPNPSSNFISLKDIPRNAHYVSIINSEGQEVYQSELETNTALDIKGLAKGFYSFQILDSSLHLISSENFIKSN